jgi:hypothetical protein
VLSRTGKIRFRFFPCLGPNDGHMDRSDRTDKRCTHCRQILPVEEFPPDLMVSTGLSSWCRECHREATRAWRARRREKLGLAT